MPVSAEILGLGTKDRGDGLGGVLQVVADFAQNCIDDAVNNLQQEGKIASGGLADSMKVHQLKFMGNVYTLQIKVVPPGSNYFDFVNEGVSGTQTKHATRFSFKNNRVSKEFAKSLLTWITRRGIKDIKFKKYSTISAQEGKNRSVSEVSKQMSVAYAIGTSIKKKGIRPSHFWDKSFNKNFPKLEADVARAFKDDVVFILTDVRKV